MHFNFALLTAFYITLVTIFNNSQPVECSKDEQVLMRRLMREYRAYVRPVSNASLPLTVEIQLRLKQIVNLDVRNQILKTNLWLDYYWKDSNLVWNPVSTFLTTYLA